jgi:hypothetical protein
MDAVRGYGPVHLQQYVYLLPGHVPRIVANTLASVLEEKRTFDVKYAARRPSCLTYY